MGTVIGLRRGKKGGGSPMSVVCVPAKASLRRS